VVVQQRWELEYVRGDVEDSDEVQGVADEVLAELSDPNSEASAVARGAGLDPRVISNVRVDVREGQQGAEPIATTIIVGILVSAGSEVAKTLWKEVLWPRIQRRLGSRALPEPVGGGA
jgi:hypothetical protein